VQNTICGSAHACSPDDGHNDARNTLRQKFDNKHQISCILLVSLSSPYVHDARSQEPKKKVKIMLVKQSLMQKQNKHMQTAHQSQKQKTDANIRNQN